MSVWPDPVTKGQRGVRSERPEGTKGRSSDFLFSGGPGSSDVQGYMFVSQFMVQNALLPTHTEHV